MIYWTKRKTEIDELGMTNVLNEFELIQETDLDYVPHGDGMEINMNGIDYSEYKEHPEQYEIVNGVLTKIEEQVETEEDLLMDHMPEETPNPMDSIMA